MNVCLSILPYQYVLFISYESVIAFLNVFNGILIRHYG